MNDVISVRSGGISTGSQGQRSKVKIVTRPNAVMMEACGIEALLFTYTVCDVGDDNKVSYDDDDDDDDDDVDDGDAATAGSNQ